MRRDRRRLQDCFIGRHLSPHTCGCAPGDRKHRIRIIERGSWRQRDRGRGSHGSPVGLSGAIDDLYIRLGHGPANAKRAEIPAAAPRALDPRAQIRYLRAVEASPSPRDRALALIPFYAGARLAETVALDLDDIRLSARKGLIRILGKGERIRELPIHEKLRKALVEWLDERPSWPDAGDTPAVFLNQRGQTAQRQRRARHHHRHR